jgi:alpha-galactosidase
MTVDISDDLTMQRWTIENEMVVCAVFVEDGQWMWSVEPRSDQYPRVGPSPMPSIAIDGHTLAWNHGDVRRSTLDDGSYALHVTLRSDPSTVVLERTFQLFPDRPFVRLSGSLVHREAEPQTVTDCEIIHLHVASMDVPTLFRVEQFGWTYSRDHFKQHQTTIVTGRAPLETRMGSFASYYNAPTSCAWFALRDGPVDQPEEPLVGKGLVGGIEFNGKSRLRTWKTEEYAVLVSSVDDLQHVLAPNVSFEIPACFIGLFHGDWDEAGYVTQRFAEQYVHPTIPNEHYPWVQYNSWAYNQQIDAAQQLAAIERCAALGIELVVLDLGWARHIGEWRHDPAKFPDGLLPLAERAHALGMRFGVHVALAQAAPESWVAREHPDWLIHHGNDYFGAAPLCLGHEPCRTWLIDQLSTMIEMYDLDYIVQDGEDMVKWCQSTEHTHAPGDSNYSNSTLGLDLVIDELKRRHPHFVWENCEDGGCMMTYRMARMYHTTITVDNIATYPTRQGIYGASFPFGPRYSVRYMQDDPTPYTLRSSIFGGPLILMHRVTDWNEQQMEDTRAAIEQYKSLRTLIRDGKVIHLLPPRYNVEHHGRGWDAIQSVAADGQRSVVMVYRAKGDTDRKTIKPRGLLADTTYQVTFADHDHMIEMTGAALASTGIEIELDELGAEILRIEAR